MKFEAVNAPGSAFVSFEEATQFLERMASVFGVRHLSYWSLSLSDGLPDQVTWISTYDPAYMNHYMGKYTPLGDPAFEAAGSESRIIDWHDLNANDAAAEAIQRAAAKFGIARHGLSYPFRDGPDRAIMFSVNVDCGDAEWPAERQRIAAAFTGFARYFHSRAMPLVESRRVSDAA